MEEGDAQQSAWRHRVVPSSPRSSSVQGARRKAQGARRTAQGARLKEHGARRTEVRGQRAGQTYHRRIESIPVGPYVMYVQV